MTRNVHHYASVGPFGRSWTPRRHPIASFVWWSFVFVAAIVFLVQALVHAL